MIKIIIISLKDSPRRDSIKENLLRCGIVNFEFHDAFDARKLTLNELEDVFDLENFKVRYNRLPLNGEVGCTISHLSVFRKIIKEEYVKTIILEDDAIFENKISNLECLNKNGIIVLGHSKTKKETLWLQRLKQPLHAIDENGIGFNNRINFFGTVGYIVNLDDARKIIDSFDYLPYIITDDWEYYSSIGVNVFQMINPVVFEDLNLESSIGNNVINCHAIPRSFSDFLFVIKLICASRLYYLIDKFKF